MAKGILNVGGGVVSVDASGNFTVDTGLIADGASVFNETGVDVDFRIESDDNANMLFVDGGNDRVGIGVATPAAQLEVEQGSTGGVVAFTIDNNDTDKVAMSIEAANIDADVMDISMDAVTTARGIDITADGLTTGSALRIDSDSSSTGTRTIASIIQNNTSASGATTLFLQNDHATAPALRVVGAVQIGVDDVGHDVKFFGATASRYWLWDESADGVVQRGTLTVGVDDTGHDVKFFGAASGAFMLWDESANTLEIRGAAADASTSSGKLLLSNAQTAIRDGDVVGRIDFQSPLENDGSDAILVTASIWAEADTVYGAADNQTELVFATAASETAAEKMRLTSDGDLILGPAVGAAIWFGDGDSGLTEGSDDDLIFKGAGSTLIAFRSAERRFRADATGSPNLYINAGTVGAPTYTFNDDNDTGMYRISADTLGFSTGGQERMRVDSGNNGIGYGGALREVKKSGTTDTGSALNVDVTIPNLSTGMFVTAHKTHQQQGWDSYFLGFIGSNTNSSNTYTRDISRNNTQAGTITASRTSTTNVRVVLGAGNNSYPCTYHILVSAY